MKQIDYIALINDKGADLSKAWKESFCERVPDTFTNFVACKMQINQWNSNRRYEQREVILTRTVRLKGKFTHDWVHVGSVSTTGGDFDTYCCRYCDVTGKKNRGTSSSSVVLDAKYSKITFCKNK